MCRVESAEHDGKASVVSNGDAKRDEALTNGANGVSEGDDAVKKNGLEDHHDDDDEEDIGDDDDEEDNEDDDEDNDGGGDEEEEDCEYYTGRLGYRVRLTKTGSLTQIQTI